VSEADNEAVIGKFNESPKEKDEGQLKLNYPSTFHLSNSLHTSHFASFFSFSSQSVVEIQPPTPTSVRREIILHPKRHPPPPPAGGGGAKKAQEKKPEPAEQEQEQKQEATTKE